MVGIVLCFPLPYGASLEIKWFFICCLRLYFPLSGNYWNGSVNNVGNNGNYWSSVVNNSNNAYNPNYNSDGDVYPDDNNNRNNGNSVRCVAR